MAPRSEEHEKTIQAIGEQFNRVSGPAIQIWLLRAILTLIAETSLSITPENHAASRALLFVLADFIRTACGCKKERPFFTNYRSAGHSNEALQIVEHVSFMMLKLDHGEKDGLKGSGMIYIQDLPDMMLRFDSLQVSEFPDDIEKTLEQTPSNSGLFGSQILLRPMSRTGQAFGKIKHFDFWSEWYQGFLDDKPMDWELQKRVALIEDAIWESGPEAVAKEIERIRAQYQLEQRIAELESALLTSSGKVRGIGDNNPPARIEETTEVRPSLTTIWEPLQELKAETLSETPDRSRVENATASLIAVLKACGLWGLAKIDKSVTAALVSAGKVIGAAGGAWLIVNADKVRDVIEAAIAWLPFL